VAGSAIREPGACLNVQTGRQMDVCMDYREEKTRRMAGFFDGGWRESISLPLRRPLP
jgi:hypothetical protein